MLDNTLYYMTMVAVVTALTEVFKKAFKIKKGWIPLISLVTGIFWSWCLDLFVYSPEMISFGIVTGISASGLFSNIKPVFSILISKFKK